jgi:spermidine synthase
VNITATRDGLRLSQHGVVISELRTSPGPTHSVFDVLAALIDVLAPNGPVGVLGFAGGGMIAPLRALGVETPIETVDLDREAYELFQAHCPEWSGRVHWEQADAGAWLHRQAPRFGLLVEDLSVPQDGDVIKPAITWERLPGLIRRRLRPGGVAVFNLMLPPGGTWRDALPRVAGEFRMARVVELDEFENRLLIGGAALPTARSLGKDLRQALRRLRSRQAAKLRARTWRSRIRVESRAGDWQSAPP